MAKSPRKHTLCTPLSIDQLYIFSVFEHKWGTRKHIDDLKKQTLMVHTSTKENETYNLRGRNKARAVKSTTVVIYEHAHMYTFLLQNCTLWEKGMVNCKICATGLLRFPKGVNKGVHLILVLKYRDHNIRVVSQMFSFTFSGNRSFMY